MSPYEAIVSREPEGPRVCQHLSSGVLLPPTPGRSWRGGGNFGAGALIPPSFISKPSIPHVASAPGPRGSSITGIGRPGWFQFG